MRPGSWRLPNQMTPLSSIDPDATGPTHVVSSGWTATDRWAWATTLPVSGIARAVASTIARHANNKTGMAWPGIGTIVEETGFGRTAVIAAIQELERGGHMTVRRFKVGKKNRANRYQLPAIAAL